MAPRPSRNLKEDATLLGDMKDDVAMDPTLWGNLKDYVAMETIYAKVPFHKFFQLRLVCKEWNHLAGDRKFLEDHFKEYLVPEPYFYFPGGCKYLVPHYSYFQDGRCMNGFLTIDITSEDVGWIGLNNPWKDRGGCFALNGLIYSEMVSSPVYLFPSEVTPQVLQKRAESRRQEVFNIHTRVRHQLPPPLQLTGGIPVVGMLVDTSVRPYGFKVIQGCGDLGTQIFDSKTNAWELRPSRLPAGIAARLDSFRPMYGGWSHHGSVNCNGLLFIATEDNKEILVYNENGGRCIGIGSWHGRLFQANYRLTVCGLTWDVVNPSRHKWEPYDRMPADLCDWLLNDGKRPSNLVIDYSKNYVLICYNWTTKEDCKNRIVLYDLATKSRKTFTFRLVS